MLTLAGFVLPYGVALIAFPLLVGCVAFPLTASVVACLPIVLSPWLVPAEFPMLRFLASMSAAMLVFKVLDVALDLKQHRSISWPEYVDFLCNPFTLVRRSLKHERRPSQKENLQGLLGGTVGCAFSVAALTGLFRLDWSQVPFLVEHVGKVTALMLAITFGLSGAGAIWRLTGGTARDFMDMPFAARTPADFWRRYNRNVQQFFWHNLFSGTRSRRAPIRTMFLVFGLSALLHEWLFLPAIGRVQGYQLAFFAVQGVAAVATARVRVRGKRVVPWVAGTLVFNLLTSVLFFASIHGVSPFYSRGLPQWLQGW